MPSKYGFGNTRTKSPYGKIGKPHYGKDQKNPIMLTEKGKKAIMASDANAGFKAAIEDAPLDMKHGTPNKMYGKAKNPLMKYKTSMKKKKPLKERSRAEQRAVFASGYKG
jgi:precorrin-6B methylase 1